MMSVKLYLSIDRNETVRETAQRLMDLAEAHIRDAGYGGFSFRDLAAEIGIKSASVHHHFPTKAILAAAVARRYGDRFLAAVVAWLRLAVGPREWCAGFFDACPGLSVGRVSSRNRERRAVLSASLAARYGYCLPNDPAARLGVSPDFPPIAERCCMHGR